MAKLMKPSMYLIFLPWGLWWVFQSWEMFGIFWALGSLLVFGGGTLALELIMRWFLRQSISVWPWVGCFAEGLFLCNGNYLKPSFYAWSEFSRYRVTGRHSSFGVALRFRQEKAGLAANNELNIYGAFNDRAELEDFIMIVEYHLSGSLPASEKASKHDNVIV